MKLFLRRFLPLFFLLYSTGLNADTYADYSYNLDTSAVTIHSGTVKSNEHDRITVTITEDGILSISLSGSNTAKFAVDTSSMPDTKTTDPTLTTYGPIAYSAGDVIYVGANAPGDNSDQSYSLTFTLMPSNSAPTDISLSSSSISENMVAGTVVGALSSTDADGGDTHTYSLVAGDGDTNNGSFDISGTNLISNAVFDFETKYTYSVRIQSDDGNGGTYSEEFTITIDDLVEGLVPTITTPQTFNVGEDAANSTSVGTVATTNSPTSFSIASGNSGGIFSIDNFGEITVSDNTNLDYDTTSSYTLGITATNASGSDTQNITIDINEGAVPIITTPQTFNVNEYASNGTSVGTILTTNSTSSFSIISGNTDSIFSIDNLGEITVSDNSNLDYASTSSYTLEINASNEYGNDIEDITINIDEGSSAPADSNSYGCDMFGSVIVTYDFLDVSGTANAQACGTENISYPNGQISGSIDCLSDIACGGTGADCERSDPPANQLTYNWTHPDDPTIANESPSPATLTDVSYGNISYSGGSAAFNASTVNPNNDNNYMYIGDATFDQTLISFTSGDYYFESFTITKNKNDVTNFMIDATNGPVRIFIKDDLSFDLNNLYLNHSGNPSDLFIYVGGNYTNPGSGGGNTHMNAYFYVEGDVILNNNSNNWIIEGGITSEGQITIAGNNPDFIESDEAGDLGYGECTVCFNNVEGTVSSPYTVSNSFVNLKGGTIYDLNVYKTYTGTNSRSGCNTTDGSCSESSVEIDFDNLENFTYGNNYDGYQFDFGDYKVFQFSTIEDINTHIFDIDEYDTTARANNNIDIDVLYIADYYDQSSNGKFYHTIVESCNLGSAGNNYSPGILDAVDTNCSGGDTLANCAGNDIATKISGKAYDLNILDSNSSSNTLFGTALAYKDNEVTYYKYIGEVNATDENGTTTFTLENSDSANDWATVSNAFATKEAWIQFYYCDSSNNWRDCYVVGGENVYITKNYDANESSSSDKYSIRPNSYQISLSAADVLSMKAGKSYTIDVNATYDSNTSNVTGYSKNLSATKIFNPDNPSCTLSLNEVFSGDFIDGAYNENNFTFGDVGDVNITFLDSIWTIIDQSNGGCTADSNSTTSDPVGCNVEAIKQVKFVPDHFNVTATFTDGSNGFTYITNQDYSISADLNITVTAQTEQNSSTTAYNDNCYAKATDYNISYVSPSITPSGNLNNIYYKESNTSTEGNSTIGTNFSITVPSSVFSTTSNGSANLNVKVNFDRDISKALNPFDLNITSIDVNDTDASGSDTLNQKATYIYGRTNAGRQRYEGTSGTANIYYEAYCFQTGCDKTLLPNGDNSKRTSDIRWYMNENHTSAAGNAGTVAEKNSLGRVTVAGSTTGNHPDNSTLMSYDKSRGYPYKTTMENNASNWLIYNEDNPTATRNQFQVEFYNTSLWSGESETGTTTKDPGTSTINRRTMW